MPYCRNACLIQVRKGGLSARGGFLSPWHISRNFAADSSVQPVSSAEQVISKVSHFVAHASSFSLFELAGVHAPTAVLQKAAKKSRSSIL